MPNETNCEFEELTVLYGSQTGIAEDVARHIHRQLLQALNSYGDAGSVARLCSCDEFLTEQQGGIPPRRLVILVCSTTGNGDPPENMRFFWRAVMSKQFTPAKLFGNFTHLEFAVLGLGDSSYERFNFVAKKLERRFEQVLQKEPFAPIGLGDDQDPCGLYTVVDPWIATLFERLGYLLPPKNSLPTFRYSIDLSSLDMFGFDKDVQICSLLDLPCDLTMASLAGSQRLTAEDHFQDVRLFRLKTSESIYYPGDVCFIQPSNIPDQVAEFVDLFGLRMEMKVKIKKEMNKKTVVVPIGDLARRYYNLSFVPTRSFFDLLSRFATDTLEKERLQELAKNYDDLLVYSLRQKRTILEVFNDFPTTTQLLRELPIDQLLPWLFELIPPIRARAFSIASAQVEVGPEIQLLVAIVKYQTKIYRPRRGLCTTWLVDLKEDPKNFSIPMWIRPSSMRFPAMRAAPATEPFPPVIMVGPGTGLAPFRAYIQYRRKLAETYDSDILWANKDDLWLFFGCRFSKRDFLCGEELLACQADGSLRLDVAFSRDTPEKVYVQHRIEAHRSDIANWVLHRGAHICIAGNALQMPKNVKTAIRDALVGKPDGGYLETIEQADAYIEHMEKTGRLVVEAWS